MVETKTARGLQSADLNRDGYVEDKELERQQKILEIQDENALRDAQRKMAWFALFGMLLYPFSVVLATWLNLGEAANILGSMAAVYFVSVAAIVSAFFGGNAYIKSKSPPSKPK